MRISRFELRKDQDGLPYLKKEGGVEIEERCLTTPEMVANFIVKAMQVECLMEEYLWIIPTNVKYKALGVMEVSHGSMDQSVASTRDIFRRLLLSGAQSFFIVHNHPSGDTTPSMDDRKSTKEINKAGILMGIRMIDHIIIGDDGKWYSFKENESKIVTKDLRTNKEE